MDTPLSDVGQKQVCAQRAILNSTGFITTNNIELIVHSPLQRARDTCMGLFADSQGPDVLTRPRVEEHPELYEKSIREHLRLSRMGPRVDAFVQWLLDRPEQRICVVGHSAFFRKMIGDRIGNCEIKYVSLAADGSWGEPASILEKPSVDSNFDDLDNWETDSDDDEMDISNTIRVASL